MGLLSIIRPHLLHAKFINFVVSWGFVYTPLGRVAYNYAPPCKPQCDAGAPSYSPLVEQAALDPHTPLTTEGVASFN